MPNSWLGVGVHVGVAAIIVAAVTLAGFPIVALIGNTIGWPLRERLQRGGTAFRLWSAQKHWEAWAPVGFGALVIAEIVARG